MLLYEVLDRFAPERTELRSRAAQNVFVGSERREVCEMITKELMASGLGPDDEPTPRGLRLEALIDVVNRPNIEPR